MQDRGAPPEHWNVAALFVAYAFIPLVENGNVCKGQQINLRCLQQGCQPLKKQKNIILNKTCFNLYLFWVKCPKSEKANATFQQLLTKVWIIPLAKLLKWNMHAYFDV